MQRLAQQLNNAGFTVSEIILAFPSWLHDGCYSSKHHICVLRGEGGISHVHSLFIMKAKLSQTSISTSLKISTHDSLTRTVLQGFPYLFTGKERILNFKILKWEAKRANSACHTNIFDFLARSIF